MTTESTSGKFIPNVKADRAASTLASLARRQALESRVEELRSSPRPWRPPTESKRAFLEHAARFVLGIGFMVVGTFLGLSAMSNATSGQQPELWVPATGVLMVLLGYHEILMLTLRAPAERNELRILEALLDTPWSAPEESADEQSPGS